MYMYFCKCLIHSARDNPAFRQSFVCLLVGFFFLMAILNAISEPPLWETSADHLNAEMSEI